MDIKALGDHVILQPLDPPEKLGGLFMSEIQQEGARQRPIGMIVSVGPQANKERAERGEEPLENNQVVLYWKAKAGIVQGLNLEKYAYCRADDIIGVVTRDEHATASDVKAERERGERIKAEVESHQRAAELQAGAGLSVPGLRIQP